ncbi:MAG: TrkH family potassium uptake protein [Halobacteria archaeon]
MLNDLRIVGRDLGGLLVVLGAVMFAPPLLFLPSGGLSPALIQAFLLPALTSIALGLTLQVAAQTRQETELKHGLVVAALAWLVIPVISTAPFMVLSGMGFIDSFFEAMSGWTTSGLSMIPKPEEAPQIILFWRSLTQWVGGAGVIVLLLTILARSGTSANALYRSEGREERVMPSVVSTVRTIWWVYLALTGMCIATLWVLGMTPFDAVNHAMATLSTGGFGTYGDSIAHFKSPSVELALIVFMAIGATSFAVLYPLFRGKAGPLLSDVQFKAFLILIALGVAGIGIELYIQGSGPTDSLRNSAFHFVSAISGTGFQTSLIDSSAWSPTAQILLAMGMIIGGAAGSTAGGIKLVRAVTAYRGTGWWFKKASLPQGAVVSFRLGEKRIPDEEANRIVAEANLITLVWILFLFVSTIVLIHVVPARYELSDVFLEVASAQGNVGLTTGISTPDLHPLGKVVLIFSMWIGRLEIIPVLMLFRSLFKGLGPI